jgi:hypothetical protein
MQTIVTVYDGYPSYWYELSEWSPSQIEQHNSRIKNNLQRLFEGVQASTMLLCTPLPENFADIWKTSNHPYAGTQTPLEHVTCNRFGVVLEHSWPLQLSSRFPQSTFRESLQDRVTSSNGTLLMSRGEVMEDVPAVFKNI